MAEDPVGFFEVRVAGEDTCDNINVYGDEPFYLGRNPALCKRYWPDATISNRHLRIHCILYEKSGAGDIPPLVYATDISSNGTFLKKNNQTCASSQYDRGILMTHKHGAFLLNEKDELQISESVTLIYYNLEPQKDLQLTLTQEREKQHFASRYLITGRQLGKGGFGKVVVAIHQKTQRELACKIINLKALCPSNVKPNGRPATDKETQSSSPVRSTENWSNKLTRYSREFRILKDLSHPNIIQVEKVIWSPSTIYIFSELITGGDLFSYMERKEQALCSIDAAVIILQILKAVEYLHDREIVHRDLKPDNVLLTYPEDGARIVLTDFGNARSLPKATNDNANRRMFSNTGTLEYIAPEIRNINRNRFSQSGYTEAVDMWSIGVIAANLLSGEAMFCASRNDHDPVRTILEQSAKCDTSILDDPAHPAWSRVRDNPKDFVRNLLVLRIEDRMTAKQALAHPWFTNKLLAAEFDALYQRSIRDWQPRRKVSKLVEPIYASSTTDDPATQKYSHHFRQPSVQASFCDIQEKFTGSQDWDLSIVLPPSEGEPLAIEHEEAHFDRPSRYNQDSFELGKPLGTEQSHHCNADSIPQLSLDQDPPASGMYDEAEIEPHQEEVFAQPHSVLNDQIATRETFPSDCDNLIETAAPISPVSQVLPELPLHLESSIVYETQLWDSQIPNPPCDDEKLREVHSASLSVYDGSDHAHKKCKLM